MTYSGFTLPEVKKAFGLITQEDVDLFAGVADVPVSDHLAETLAENVPLALAINTEKARSELIVAPLLVELRKLSERRISLFSGVDLNVDPEKGLAGTCDYLISRSTEQLFVTAPLVLIVEAKKDDLKAGLGQCIAEMVAALRLNEREATGITVVWGMVTTGSLWKGLQLEGQAVRIDREEYHIRQAGKVLGILRHMVG
jgi:hypothetical protein